MILHVISTSTDAKISIYHKVSLAHICIGGNIDNMYFLVCNLTFSA